MKTHKPNDALGDLADQARALEDAIRALTPSRQALQAWEARMEAARYIESVLVWSDARAGSSGALVVPAKRRGLDIGRLRNALRVLSRPLDDTYTPQQLALALRTQGGGR